MKKAITHCLIKFGIDHLVYFSRIGVVGCGGLSDWEELVGSSDEATRAIFTEDYRCGIVARKKYREVWKLFLYKP